MKKILTLLFAVVTVAAFALPTVQKTKKLQPQKSDAKIEMKAQKGDLRTANAGMMKDFTSGVDTMYLAPVGTFFFAYFPMNGSLWYNYTSPVALLPGNTEVTWTNISTGIASDTYDWVYYNPAIDEEYLSVIEGEKDLVCTFPNYPGWWIAPKLFATAYSEADYDAGNYYTEGGSIVMGGKLEEDVLGDGTILTGVYQFSPNDPYCDISRTSYGAGYGEDANSFFTDLPAGYKPEGAVDGKIVNFVQIFRYPGKPYAFSRIQFYAYCTAAAGNQLHAKVCSLSDGIIDLDNPIAESVYEFPEAVMGESAVIDFYFEKEDPELGLTEEEWMTIDGNMAIVIEGVNEIEEISPLLNTITYEADQAHPEIDAQIGNGYGMWEFYDASGNLVDSRFIPCHLGYYWGDGFSPENHLLSINAQFAYIETKADNATEYAIPAEGGNFTLELKASEPYDAWNVEDIPSWINIEAEDIMDEEDGSYTGYTTLTINVEPNNNGEVVYTLPGTEFKIIVGNGGGAVVVPGDVNGDGVCNSGDVTILYNYFLDGATEGLVNGDVDGDGNITSGDITFIYNLLLGSAK